MVQNIIAGILTVIAAAAGIWCWWFENFSKGEEDKINKDK